MIKSFLILLALLVAYPACAAPKPGRPLVGLGLSLSAPSDAASRAKANPASPDAALRKALEVSAEAQEDADLEAQAAEAFDLKLPEEELPESDIPLTFNVRLA